MTVNTCKISTPRKSNEVVLVILHRIEWTKEEHPTFFVSMLVNGLCLHNYMYDSRASSNVVTKKVMDQLNLKVTREIEVHRIILGLQLKLAAYQEITFQIDILVIDVPDAWGMLLSRKWGATLQMDLSYATIPFFENTFVNLHREREIKFNVEDLNEPMNEFIHQIGGIGNYVICSNFLAPTKDKFDDGKDKQVCKKNFDGAPLRSRIGIIITSPNEISHNLAFRLWFNVLDVIRVPKKKNNLADRSIVSVSTLRPLEELLKSQGLLRFLT